MFLTTLLGTGLTVILFSLVGFITIISPLIQTIIIMALIGIPVGGFMMLPFAFVADIVDEDEKNTGFRRG